MHMCIACATREFGSRHVMAMKFRRGIREWMQLIKRRKKRLGIGSSCFSLLLALKTGEEFHPISLAIDRLRSFIHLFIWWSCQKRALFWLSRTLVWSILAHEHLVVIQEKKSIGGMHPARLWCWRLILVWWKHVCAREQSGSGSENRFSRRKKKKLLAIIVWWCGWGTDQADIGSLSLLIDQSIDRSIEASRSWQIAQSLGIFHETMTSEEHVRGIRRCFSLALVAYCRKRGSKHIGGEMTGLFLYDDDHNLALGVYNI
jgi:hypothetical protein